MLDVENLQAAICEQESEAFRQSLQELSEVRDSPVTCHVAVTSCHGRRFRKAATASSVLWQLWVPLGHSGMSLDVSLATDFLYRIPLGLKRI